MHVYRDFEKKNCRLFFIGTLKIECKERTGEGLGSVKAEDSCGDGGNKSIRIEILKQLPKL